jgi:hypothetical protein
VAKEGLHFKRRGRQGKGCGYSGIQPCIPEVGGTKTAFENGIFGIMEADKTKFWGTVMLCKKKKKQKIKIPPRKGYEGSEGEYRYSFPCGLYGLLKGESEQRWTLIVRLQFFLFMTVSSFDNCPCCKC